MNKIVKKSLSILLALVMVLNFSIPAFAAPGDRPTSSVGILTPPEIASIRINGETAYYQTDDNTGSDIYIRAKVNQVLTALDAATVEINLNSAATPVTPCGWKALLLTAIMQRSISRLCRSLIWAIPIMSTMPSPGPTPTAISLTISSRLT